MNIDRCPKCGAANEIVNQCGCDPDNMPTVSDPVMNWRAYEVLRRPRGTDWWLSDGYLSVRPGETPYQAFCRERKYNPMDNDICSDGDIALTPCVGCADRGYIFWRDTGWSVVVQGNQPRFGGQGEESHTTAQQLLT